MTAAHVLAARGEIGKPFEVAVDEESEEVWHELVNDAEESHIAMPCFDLLRVQSKWYRRSFV